ncbi:MULTISPECIES: hypothetical protein [Kordiimonas]|jgi:hypothetical protein|uniref:hypothetical protein n=1 Tax=Kordiimonas TaxID=288021 RepID=UPI00257C639A|nr:hypothetical protein [Kordiimonas sp. UBA4487]
MRNPILFILILFACLLPAAPATASDADYHYSGHVAIVPESGFLKASWVIDVRDPADDQITFFIRDTLGNVTVGGEDAASSSLGQVEGMEDFTAINVDLKPSGGAARQIEISYDGELISKPLPHNINTISSEIIELNVDSFWFPIDKRFSKVLSADVTIDVPGTWHGLSTGEVQTEEGKIRITNTDPRLDIAFTLAKAPRLTQAGGFDIFDLRATDAGIEALGNTAAACMTELNARFGQTQPLPVAKLVVTSRNAGGYARENYIVLTDIGDTPPDRLTQFICHEFGHYWARGAAFKTVENWLNEAFAEYTGFVGVRTILGEEAFKGQLERFANQIEGKDLPPIWTEGATERSPYLVNYRKAPLVLAEFEKQIGRDSFLRIVQRFFAQPVKTTPQLLTTVSEVAGPEASARFKEMLAK